MPKIPCRVESGPEEEEGDSRHVAGKNGQDDTTGRDGKMWPSLTPGIMVPLSSQRPVHQGSGPPIPSALRQQPYLPLPAMRPFRLQAVFTAIERAAWAAYVEGVVPPRRAGDHARRRGPLIRCPVPRSEMPHLTTHRHPLPPENAKGAGLQKKTGPFAKSGSAQAAEASISCRWCGC